MVFVVALAWIASTIIVILAAVKTARLLDSNGGPFIVVHATVLAWSWVVAVAILLSSAKWLSGASLLVGVTGVAIIFLAASLLLPKGRGIQQKAPILITIPSWAFWAWGAMFALWTEHVVSAGLMKFTTDFDSLMYHMPLIDFWLQAGSLFAPDGTHWYNPGTGEVLGLWAVAPFPNDFLVTLSNFPVAILLAFGALELGTKVGLGPALSHLAALAVVSNFVVINQLVDTENDVAVAALFVACSCYGIRFAKEGRSVDLVLGAVALGLLCGIKYYALGYVAVVWTIASILTVRQRGIAAGLRLGATWALGGVLLGGYWYLRNFLASGSPFFPMGIARESDMLSQEYPDVWKSSFAGNGRPEIWQLAAIALWKMTGPCHFIAVLALPVTAVWTIITGRFALYREKAVDLCSEKLALVALTIGSGCVLAVTPFALEDVPGSLNHLNWAYTPARYGLSVLCLSVVMLALVLQDFIAIALCKIGAAKMTRKILILLPSTLLGAAAVYQTLFVDQRQRSQGLDTFLLIIDIMLVFALVRYLRELKPRLKLPAFFVLGCLAILGMAKGISSLSDAWDIQFARHYDQMYGSSVFTELAMLPSTRLALLDYRCHPFFGARRQISLCQPRRIQSHKWLMDYLTEHGVTHIVVRSQERGTPAGWDAYVGVGEWVAGQRRDFIRVHQDPVFSLYRVSVQR